MPPSILIYYIEREKNIPIKDRYYYLDSNINLKNIISNINNFIKKN